MNHTKLTCLARATVRMCNVRQVVSPCRWPRWQEQGFNKRS